MSTISFSVDEKTKREIAKMAKHEGRTQSELFREIWGQHRFQRAVNDFARLNRKRFLELGIQSDDDVERVFG